MRYDLPKSPPPPSHVTGLLQPVEVQGQQGDQQPIISKDEEEAEDDAEVAGRPGVSYSRQQTREDTSSLALDIQPQEVIVDETSSDVPHKAEAEGGQHPESMAESVQESIVGGEEEESEQSDGESHKPIETNRESAEMEPHLEETSSASVQESTQQAERSLQEEMQEVERGAGGTENGAGAQVGGTESQERSAGAGRREDDYVAQEEVEGYLARMKQEGENYVDEHQVLFALQHL